MQHALWGLNPLGYHQLTLLFHAAGALVLWRTLAAWRLPGAWLGAAAWALHPVQVESVAWICELKNTQSGFFYFLAILFYRRWLDASREPGTALSRRGYILALLCAVLALLSKPSTVMLPVVLGLAAWWRRRAFSWRDLVPLIPFLGLSAVVSGWTIWEQRAHSTAIGPEWDQSFAERLILAGRCVWFYLGKLAWPEPLMFLYPRWHLDAAPWSFVLAVQTPLP